MSLRVLKNLEQGSEVKPADEARFAKFVAESDPKKCWEWQSVRNRRGYGKFWLNGRTDLAHRVAYRIGSGDSIPAGLLVRHSCDNPPCVNPAHLLVGTVKDNSRDAIERNRMECGSENGNARLNEEQVLEIKRLWASGGTQVSMAKQFGVSRAAIQWILNGRSWKKVREA